MNKNTSEHENHRQQSVLVFTSMTYHQMFHLLVNQQHHLNLFHSIQSNDDHQNVTEYNLIEAVEPYLVATITRMIIHKQATQKLMKLLSNNTLLHNKTSQATDRLLDDNSNEYTIL